MEDDYGLDLGLGLSCGGSSLKSKGKSGSLSSDTKTDEGDGGSKIMDDFKNFLNPSIQKQDPGTGSHRSDHETVGKPWAEASNKRKLSYDEINNQKKSTGPTKASHISLTEDGSTAENEDVADSEVDGSTSRLSSLHDGGGGGSTDGLKEVHGFNEFKIGKMGYGVPYPVQSVNIMNVPRALPVKESTPGYPLPSIGPVVPPSTSERPTINPVNHGNMQMAFGFSPVQLSMFNKENSWGLSHPQLMQVNRGVVSNSDKHHDGVKISQAMQIPAHNSSEAKGDGKQPATEEGSSSQTEDDRKRKESSPLEGSSSIRSGISADLKFGGSGSIPDLPWVSTKGPGPNGRTISGVTYQYSRNQVRVVCACHGSHMSLEGFVQHASADEKINPESDSGLASNPSNNPAASAQT